MNRINIPIVEISDSNFDTNSAKIGYTPSLNIEPILHEIQYALIKLLKSQQSSVIDLNAMPFAPGEKEKIRQELGNGEVEILLNAMGKSLLFETDYPGVWWIEHYNDEEQVTGTYIEIAPIPEIIQAVDEEISIGLQRLTQTLNDRSESYENE